jgi:hypothetical protein
MRNLARLWEALKGYGETLRWWDDEWPIGTDSHPYGFKIYALEAALRQGFDTLLWCDSSIVPIAPLTSLWNLIESQGYWFSRNYHGATNGEWCCDSALPILEVSREESFKIPHVVATAFGLDLRCPLAQEWLSEWKRLMLVGAFDGPHCGGSSDPRVKGHRHDQAAASVLCWRMGMKLTTPPEWFVDADQGGEATEETVLVAHRG